MRSFPPAVLLCLALASAGGAGLIAFAAHGGSPGRTPAAPAAAPPAAPKPATPPAAGGNVDNDAPARHARRTACLRDAKSKKLVGAQRTAYVKNCIGAI